MDATSHFIKFTSGNAAAHEVLTYITEIEEDIAAALHGTLELPGDGGYNKLTAADIRLALFARARARGGVPQCIRNMLLESVIKLEKTSGFAGFIAVLSCTQLLKHKIHEIMVGNTAATVDIDEELHIISNLSRRSSKSIAFKAIRKYIRNPLSSSIVLQACSMTGHNGQLYIDKDYASSTSLELTNGYTFPLHVEPNFSASVKMEEWKEYNVKTLIIDGIIETVGEINRILEYFHDEKRPGVIFARGFNNEVLGTLSVNKARETLNVIPVVVPYDLEGINMLVDLAKVCGTDIVSSLKGDVISGIDPHDIVTIDKLVINKSNAIISNEKTSWQVKHHINNILEQKRNTPVSDKKDLFDKRTKALSSVCTNIKLASNLNNKDSIYSQIQHGINMLKHICRYGVVDSRLAMEGTNNAGIKNMFRLLVDNELEDLSAKELVLGLKTGESLANSILSSSAYLILDTDDG